ncbi:MAG: glycosyltransferase family 2 protein [Nitrospirae bacterium]|nr:glycosyltransferase family 2 protein [Nitrospirota bacterium]
MKLSVVIPLFNEEAVIDTTYSRLSEVIAGLTRDGLVTDYEILFVDDGSRDRSLEILRRLAAGNSGVKVISLSRNFGHQKALAAGLLHCSGDAVVSLDADLQDPPELIRDMLEKYRKGKDIVYGVRRARGKDTFFKRVTARFFYRMMQAMGVDLIYDHADYRLVSRAVVEAFRAVRETNIFLRGIFPYLGFSHEIVYYDRDERHAGETKYPLRKMLAFAWEGITSFSNVPLRLASFSGLIISIASLALVLWAFYEKFAGRTIPGWTSTVIPIFFIGGLNILFLGLIGEYIGKIYLEVKRRPLFFIRETHNLGGFERRD